MNERILELAKNDLIRDEYTEFGWQECHYYRFDPDELQKFAELIVKECAGIVEDAVTHREPASTYVGKIREHFGVEE